MEVEDDWGIGDDVEEDDKYLNWEYDAPPDPNESENLMRMALENSELSKISQKLI